MGARLWGLAALVLVGCDPAEPEDTGPCTEVRYFEDIDGDGYGTDVVLACEQPPDTALQGGDCDDFDGLVHPGAAEACNGKDDDCDGSVSNDERDDDRDGSPYCADCNDDDPNIYPGAPERCNDIDDDCDLEIDEDGPESTVYYRDDDGDGFGEAADTRKLCAPSGPWVEDAGDCNDVDALVNPGVPERCDDVDWNCDGTARPGWEATDEASLKAAVRDAEPGATVCLAEGTYALELLPPAHVTLEGVGEVTLVPARTGAPALSWVEPEKPGSIWGLANVTLLASSEADQLMTWAGSPAPMHGRDLRITSADGSCAQLSAPSGTWTGVEIDHLTCEDEGRSIWTNLELVDLYLHDVEHTVTQSGVWSGLLKARRIDGARVEALRIIASGDGVRGWDETPIQTDELVDVVVTDVVVDLGDTLPNVGWIGGFMETERASNLDFSAITLRAEVLQGALLQATEVDGFVLHDVDAEIGYRLSGLVSTPRGPSGAVSYADITVSDVSVTSGRHVWGGLFLLESPGSPSLSRVSVARVDVSSAEKLQGGLIYALGAPGWTATDLDVRDVSISAPEASGILLHWPGGELAHSVFADLDIAGDKTTGLLYGSQDVHVTFATWRDIQRDSRTELRLVAHPTCAVDHLDLSDSTLNMESTCAFSFTNLWAVEGLTIEASALEPTYADVSSDDATLWDLHLGEDSPLIDAGDPDLLESDGSAADISAYGGR